MDPQAGNPRLGRGRLCGLTTPPSSTPYGRPNSRSISWEMRVLKNSAGTSRHSRRSCISSLFSSAPSRLSRLASAERPEPAPSTPESLPTRVMLSIIRRGLIP